jgi:hypothetical protein
MGILAPLFLAGLVGLSIPLVLHLVRRTPKGRQQFSSLMFLAPTPPRLTRRSRLDQVLLLLMRLAALALLVFAFSRPFLRETALLSLNDLPRRRVALLLDTSASMRRADVWQQAQQAVTNELDDLGSQDEVALFTFDDKVEAIVNFQAKSTPNSAAPVDVVRAALKQVKPTWAAGDLGTALTSLASELDAERDVQQAAIKTQLVVISDFQQGSRLEALQGFEWPKENRVSVVTRAVKARQTSNASLQLLASEEEAPADELRVRVVNAADSGADQFFVRWLDPKQPEPKGDAKEGEVAVYVPPGQSRVIKLPRPMNNLLADRVVLRGDAHDFDNAYYVVPPRQQQISLIYLGSDKEDDPQGWQYYLRLAMSGDPLRQVDVTVIADDKPLSPQPRPQVVVATRAPSNARAGELKTFVEAGGSLVLVPPDSSAAKTLPTFFPDVQVGEEPKRRGEADFRLLGEIDFTSPLFQPFASPRYNDFTRIHFWRHRPVTLKTDDDMASTRSHVLARFDNGEPWLLERSLGKGRVWAFTSGWQPDDSQLAVSSKFLPLVGSLLDQACGAARSLSSVAVNTPVRLPADRDTTLQLKTPDGQTVAIDASETSFRATTEPGIYRAGLGQDEFRFAVNVPASESETAPLPMEQLEQLGVKLGQSVTKTEELTKRRQEHDTELESRQQFWRWILIGCFGFLLLETWWAARVSQAPVATQISPEAAG